MEPIANNVIRVPCDVQKLFYYWFLFLKPFHNLTNREIGVIAAFAFKRYELSKVISDISILDKVVMSEDTKKKIREENNISPAYFQVIMGKLKRNNVLINNRINPKFIPNITEGSDAFKLMLLFEIK